MAEKLIEQRERKKNSDGATPTRQQSSESLEYMSECERKNLDPDGLLYSYLPTEYSTSVDGKTQPWHDSDEEEEYEDSRTVSSLGTSACASAPTKSMTTSGSFYTDRATTTSTSDGRSRHMPNFIIQLTSKWAAKFGNKKRPKIEFIQGEWVANGHFGDVYHGSTVKDGTEVAIKTVREKRLAPDEFLREAQLLSHCCQENVISLKAVCYESQPHWMVMDYMENGNLRKFLIDQMKDHHPLSMPCLIGIIKQVANAMMYVSTQLRFVHRDLAARNVLVGAYRKGFVPEVKVSDFGLARQLKVGQELYRPAKNHRCLLALRHSSPEVITHNIFSVKSDVWAFAMSIYEIVSHGKNPFKGISKPDMVNYVVWEPCTSYPMLSRLPADCPLGIAHLMKICWSKDTRYRPTFVEIVDYLNTHIHLDQPIIGDAVLSETE